MEKKEYLKTVIGLFFIVGIAFSAFSQQKSDLEKWLNSIDGLTFERTPLDSVHQDVYTIFLNQYIDIDHPEKGSFKQRIYLTHIDRKQPMVLITEGYGASYKYISEPAKMIGANQLIVEHRYFGKSCPDSLDWSALTVKNASADYHHIYTLFSHYYQNKWLSSGVSKGGQTTIFYKYFYPEDMDICMPYVAPLNLEQEDPRINLFLRQVGSKEEQERILHYQRLMLNNFDSIFPLYKDLAAQSNQEFAIEDTLTYEFMVLEFPFSYWQWASLPFDSIPQEMKSASDMLKPMIKLNLADFYYKRTLEGLMPFMVQAYRELGYYHYDLDSLKNNLIKLDDSSNIVFVPDSLRFEYDSRIMNDIYTFIHNKGNQFIYVYGELDPWFSTSVNPDSRVDALKMVLSGGSHLTRIRHFTKEEQDMVKKKLETWLNKE